MQYISQINGRTANPVRGLFCRRLVAGLACTVLGAAPGLADVTSLEVSDTTADAGLSRESGGQSAALLSAFFGLDNGLPRLASRAICRGAFGKDGM
ncbi:MAG: hypothetical protein AAFO51_03795, partial [Pseudomonadota bacterium]